jgi:hypothetical protein
LNILGSGLGFNLAPRMSRRAALNALRNRQIRGEGSEGLSFGREFFEAGKACLRQNAGSGGHEKLAESRARRTRASRGERIPMKRAECSQKCFFIHFTRRLA